MNGTRTTGLWMAAVAVGALAMGPELMAQDSLAEKILGLNSGAFGITIQVILILMSIFMVGWAIECFINVRREKIVPPETVAHLEGYIAEGNLEGALQYCEASPNLLTRTIGAALGRASAGFDTMKAAAEQQMAVENGKLVNHISPLSLVAALGPMMGLFGTVSGMVMAFDTMAIKGAAMSPADVASSIGLALMSTVIGLIIAMPGMAVFWFMGQRVNTLVDDYTLITDDLLDRMRPIFDKQG